MFEQPGPTKLFTVPCFLRRSSGSSTYRHGRASWFQMGVAKKNPPCTTINPRARALGTYENKMAALNGKGSIWTI